MPGYRCATCGQYHEGPTLAFGCGAPELYYQIPPDERAARAEMTSDVCVIDEKFFFLLGNIELPIVGTDESFVWMAWVSLGENNFRRAIELWRRRGRES